MSKCKDCGSDVIFDPASQLLKCNSCNQEFNINHQDLLAAEKQEYEDIKEYTCPQCGGSIFTTDSTAATFCSFCGTSVILECKDANYKKPDGIIPFKVTKEEAKEAYLAKIKKSRFAPKNLKDDKMVEKIRGIYMPYQVAMFDGAGYASIVSDHHRTSGNYSITETMRDTMNVEVTLNVTHDALKEFSDIISEGVEPFNLEEIKEYSSAYLSGFYADKPDLDESIMKGNTETGAKELCERAIIKEAIKGNQLKEIESMPKITCKEVKTILCPVWFISNKQPNGSISYAAINGQTGEVAAEVPIDKKLFLKFSAIAALIAYVILILIVSFSPHNAISIMGALALVASYITYEEAEELYVHNKELEGITIPVKTDKSNKPLNPQTVFLTIFFGIIPTIMGVMILYELLGVAGIIAAGLIILLLLKKILRKQQWFQEIFGRDYEIPKGSLTKYIIKPLIAAVFALFVFLINPVEDIVQYISAGIVFVFTLWSFLDIIKIHNQLSSRKPTQLMKRGGDDNA